MRVCVSTGADCDAAGATFPLRGLRVCESVPSRGHASLPRFSDGWR